MFARRGEVEEKVGVAEDGGAAPRGGARRGATVVACGRRRRGSGASARPNGRSRRRIVDKRKERTAD